jgi:hypothetical protein
MPKIETPQKKYLYCLIRTDQPHQFSARGMGERGDIVNTINYMDLAVVASDTDELEYNESRRNMMTHTLVLEEVMQEFPILPIRFGTVAPNEESVIEQVLKRRYGGLISEFEEIENRVELGLKAFWFDEIIFEEIVKENAPIRHLRDELVGRSPESTYYERIKLGEMIEAAMNKKRDLDAERILSRLRPFVDKTRTNKVITDKMIINAAFLVNKSKEAALDDEIQKIDSEMGKRIMFKYVGPVPPYNFVNIIINWDK